jgi:hypothetical protein
VDFTCEKPTINLLQLQGLQCGTEGENRNAYAGERKRKKEAEVWISKKWKVRSSLKKEEKK